MAASVDCASTANKNVAKNVAATKAVIAVPIKVRLKLSRGLTTLRIIAEYGFRWQQGKAAQI
ncbi:MAG: hypothetical protein WCO36_04955 [Actinomycetes bacterium]